MTRISPLSLPPSVAPRWDLEVGDRAEAFVHDPLHIGRGGDADIRIDGVADDGGKRLALAAPAGVEYARSRCAHLRLRL